MINTAPPYQQSPGASTTEAAQAVYWATNYCSVLYKEKDTFNLQRSLAGCSFSDAAVHGHLRSVC